MSAARRTPPSRDGSNAYTFRPATAETTMTAFRKPADLTVIYQKNNFAGGTLSYTMYTGGPP